MAIAGMEILYLALGSFAVTSLSVYAIQKFSTTMTTTLTTSQILGVGAIAAASTAIAAGLLKMLKLVA